ncbi:hypothetical protein [Ferrovibrio sp.]|uniref:hypothetical protein n=1 Tax=Ferrovibrio sp. TaxID=1917215 RepID=UPI0035AF6B20
MKKNPDLHRHIAALNAAFRQEGYKVKLSGDHLEFREAISKIAGYSLTSPLDDRLVDLAKQLLWIGIEDSKGRLVGIEAGRVVKAPVKAGGLNRILNDEVFGRVLPVITKLPSVNLAGRLGYLGGAWVEPKLRGNGIMSLAVQLTAAHLVRCYGVDSVFGFVRSHHVGLALAAKGYAFTSATVIDLMYLHGSSEAETLCMVWTDPGVLAERYAGPAAYSLRPESVQSSGVKTRKKSRH